MQRYDFTKLGGFPLTQDVLNDMQGQYMTMMQKLCGNFGPGPYIISGMVQAGGSITDGWFYYNGDVIPFTGGVIPTPAGGSVVLVQITIGTGTLLFNDGSSPVVKISPTAALTTGATVTDATHFPLSILQNFGREANWNHYNKPGGAPNFVSGDIYYKKNFVANTLYIKGVIYIDSSGFVGLAPGYITFTTLPSGYRPNTASRFGAWRNNTGFIYDGNTPAAPIKGTDLYLDTSGVLTINVVAEASGALYTVEFNTVIPLD